MEDVLDCVFDKLEDVAEKFRRFSIGEIGILKTCCITFGLLVGAFHARKVKKNALFILLAFLMSAVYLMIRICFDDDDDWEDDYEDDDFDPAEFMSGGSRSFMDDEADAEQAPCDCGCQEKPCDCEEKPCDCTEEPCDCEGNPCDCEEKPE